MRVIKTLLLFAVLIILALIGLAFITHNQLLVTVNLLLVESIEAPIYLWLIGFFIMGGLFGLLFSSLLILKEKTARLQLERRLQNTSKLITGYSS